MNINIDELNEIAQVITYGLRAFNPETMLFGDKTSAVRVNTKKGVWPAKCFGVSSKITWV